LTDFLTEYGVVVALVCAGAAVIYGLLVTQRLLAKPAGNDRMQEISGAVQEGAQAYLNRQYTIIAALAVPIAVLLLVLQDYKTAIGFLIGATLSGATGFIGMNVSVRANSRVAEAARGGVPPRSTSPSKAARSPVCSWSAWRCSASPATTESWFSPVQATRRPSTR